MKNHNTFTMKDTPFFKDHYALDEGVVALLQKILTERYTLWKCLVDGTTYARAHFMKSAIRQPTNNAIFFEGYNPRLIFRSDRERQDLELVFSATAREDRPRDGFPSLLAMIILQDCYFTDNYKEKRYKKPEDFQAVQYPEETRLSIDFEDYVKEINIYGLSFQGLLSNEVYDNDPDEEREFWEVDIYLECFLAFSFENIDMTLIVLGHNLLLLPRAAPLVWGTGWNLNYQILRTLTP